MAYKNRPALRSATERKLSYSADCRKAFYARSYSTNRPRSSILAQTVRFFYDQIHCPDESDTASAYLKKRILAVMAAQDRVNLVEIACYLSLFSLRKHDLTGLV